MLEEKYKLGYSLRNKYLNKYNVSSILYGILTWNSAKVEKYMLRNLKVICQNFKSKGYIITCNKNCQTRISYVISLFEKYNIK